ncbi:MAG: hypothetical protein IKT63_01430 [Oscillospiraceae bacterium]|nr:hypothetical protein [Oscillospiraceae bacterium]
MLLPQGSISLLIKFGLKGRADVLRRTQQKGGEISSFHRRCCLQLYMHLVFPKSDGAEQAEHCCFKAEHRCFEAEHRRFVAKYCCFKAEHRCFEAKHRCFDAEYRCFTVKQL